jgi:glycosyltransferase involved in cell wall biosynthesis
MRVIPHGIGPQLALCRNDPEIVKILNLGSDSFLVICPSRADEHKDAETFIDAIPLMCAHRADIDWRFLVACQDDDPCYDKIRQRIKQLKLDESRIVLRKFLYQEMATILRKADVCVVPSRHESFGLSVLEAFLLRTPVVVANVGGLAEIVENTKNGLSFSDGIFKELAGQVLRLHRDKNLRDSIVENAHALVLKGGRFYIDQMVGAHEKLYSDIQSGSALPTS